MRRRATTLAGAALLGLLGGCTGAIDGGATSVPGPGGPTDMTGGPGPGEPGVAQPGTPPGTAAPPVTPAPPAEPGREPAPPAASCTGTPRVGPAKLRRLTATQYRASIKDLLAIDVDTSTFLADAPTGPFATNTLVPPQEAEIARYEETAGTVAARAVADPKRLLECDPAATGEQPCVERFLGRFLPRLYRRPPAPEETQALLGLYKVGREESFATGLRLLLKAALQSPSFLYLVEGGTTAGVTRLTGYEVATRLSYVLWDSTPDAALLEAARAGMLDDAAGVRRQAERLIASERFLVTAQRFFVQLVGAHHLLKQGLVTKDAAKFPMFDAAMRQAMVDETGRFVTYVLTKGDGAFETLMSAPWVFPGTALAKVYGDLKPAADGRVEITDGTRAGLLTQAAVLATEPPMPTIFAPVYRGKVVRLNLFCTELAAPPEGVMFKTPPGADKLNSQEILRVHKENPTCSGCHDLMDPIGFGLENFDPIGRHVTKAADGLPIDARGSLSRDPADAFVGPKALAEKLARHPDVRACMATQWFRFALGREPSADDVCARDTLAQALTAGRGDIRQALLTFVSSDAFRYRRGE